MKKKGFGEGKVQRKERKEKITNAKKGFTREKRKRRLPFNRPTTQK